MPFERVARLEAQIEQMVADMNALKRDVAKIKEMMTEGRGAVRLARYLIGAAVIFGGGWVGHDKRTHFLRWLGG